MRIRDLGYAPGEFEAGPTNSILDVPGACIAQVTVPTSSQKPSNSDSHPGASAPKKGVTVLLPRPTDQAHVPCHAGTATFNGNGEMTGLPQMSDWGFTNMPIVLTNSLSLGVCYEAAWDFMLSLYDTLGLSELDSSRNYGTPVIAETADWMINSELRSSRLSGEDVAKAFASLKSREQGGEVREGSAGGGAGMTCHHFKGGTGTASRLVGGGKGGKEYVLGVLVQTNYGGLVDLQIGGVPIGKLLMKENDGIDASKAFQDRGKGGRTDDGSFVVVMLTDAPLLPHQLNRLARHATAGLAQVGGNGIGRTFSGDLFLALSNADHPKEQLTKDLKMSRFNPTQTYDVQVVKNECIDSYFQAAGEAVEEAILNSLVGARDGMTTMSGSFVKGLPVDRVKALLEQYRVQI